MMDDAVSRLRQEVVEPLKRRFVGRDEVVNLIALAVTAGEHLFLHGPPGTAKSALIRQFATAVRASYFEYLLTRFSEPNEVFGPIDLVRLREGTVATVTTGMLPEGEFIFLDELFNANSAILNNLLTVLNERVYRRGAETHRLPLLSLFAASNHLPEDEALGALFDRFLLRCHIDNLKREEMPRLLAAGWELEQAGPIESSVSSADLRALSGQVYRVDLGGVADRYADVVWKVRDLGIGLTDRRSVKVLKLVAASAVLCGRAEARISDFWVLRYLWDREEQVAPWPRWSPGSSGRMPSSRLLIPWPPRPNASTRSGSRARLEELAGEIQSRKLGVAAAARAREQLTDLVDRAAWLPDDAARKYLVNRAGDLLKWLG